MALPPVMNIVLFVLMLAAWLVMLGGAAAYDDKYNLPDSAERQLWWPVWFEFFLLILFVVCIVTGRIGEWKGVLVAFAAMASAYLMPVAERWLSALDGNPSNEDIVRCNAAGTIMVIIVNWICIILYGNDSFREMVESKAEGLKGEPTA